MPAPPRGSLVCVGVGINALTQITPESEAHMRTADVLFYLVLDPVTEFWLKSLNVDARSMKDLYATNKPRRRTYDEMVARITGAVFAGRNVCVAFYGHPAVLVYATRQTVKMVKAKGLPARIVPAISTEACLYADLALDPGLHGVQSYEATDFLLRKRKIDPTSALILWQIGVLGEGITRDPSRPYRSERMRVLVRTLARHYPLRHKVVLYQAASRPGFEPNIDRLALGLLAGAQIRPLHTLYVPALRQRGMDAAVAAWLKQPS